jgi:O-succinylbenzoic acid--CoA ligase
VNYLKINTDFKLNGNSFSTVDELFVYSRTLSSSTHQFLKEWFSVKEVIEVKTSGSTGKPKIIALKKEFMVNSALATGAFFNLPEKKTALLCMSIHYIAGKMMLVRAIVLGWHLDIVEPTSNPLKGLHKQYDFSAMVPMQLQNSLLEIEKVKKLIIGGGIVSEELEAQIQTISTEVFATFGMTETITHIAVKKLNKPHQAAFFSAPHYQVLPGVSIAQDERNCLVIDAPKVSENKSITNDVVVLISDKEFKWLGRYDTIINSGGIKLHPEEIEKKLSKIIQQRFFVAGIPDKILGEKLILIIEKDVVSSTLDTYKNEKSFLNQLEINLKGIENLTKYEIPKAIYFVTQFIETDTKKIQRKKTLKMCTL